MPSFHLATTFLGQPCGAGPTHGVNPEMQLRLQAAEKAARDAAAGRADETFTQWAAAVPGPHVCWQPHAGQHSAGAAIDIDPASNPYIVTRYGTQPGGEPGAEHLVDMRERALAVYDRAMRFATPPAEAADVAPRRPDEPTTAVWTRFKAVSDALARYLSFAVASTHTEVSRVAVEDADRLSDDELLATIPEGERLAFDDAVSRLAAHLTSAAFRDTHPGWALDARALYLRMLRDYEQARIPMVIGSPSATPARTRNPARGFLRLPLEIVTALCDQGLRWGACDFEVRADGSSDNGAMMHFDIADAGGYPEVHSLLRFG